MNASTSSRGRRAPTFRSSHRPCRTPWEMNNVGSTAVNSAASSPQPIPQRPSACQARFSAARVHVEIRGEPVTGHLNDHPAFRNVIASYAELYDMQHAPAYRDGLTSRSRETGERVATSFLTPHTPQDLDKRQQA